MTTYEYKVVRVEVTPVEIAYLTKHLEVVLNELGKEGWEVIHASLGQHVYVYHLKKRLEIV